MASFAEFELMCVAVIGDEVVVCEGFIVVLNPERVKTGEGAMPKEDCECVIVLGCISHNWWSYLPIFACKPSEFSLKHLFAALSSKIPMHLA